MICMENIQNDKLEKFVEYIHKNADNILVRWDFENRSIRLKTVGLCFLNGNYIFQETEDLEKLKEFYKSITGPYEKICVQQMMTFIEIVSVPDYLLENIAKMTIDHIENTFFAERDKVIKKFNGVINQ